MYPSYMSSYRMVLHSAIRYGFFKPPGYPLSRRLSRFIVYVRPLLSDLR